MYKVEFYNKNGKLIEFCEFALCAGESFTDKLEEVLYFMCELTPYSREWKKRTSPRRLHHFYLSLRGIRICELQVGWFFHSGEGHLRVGFGPLQWPGRKIMLDK